MRFIKPQNLNCESFILDIRSPEEYARETLDLPHIYKCWEDIDPLTFIKENHLEDGKTINILCRSGCMASKVAEMFEKAGVENVAVIIGGIVEAEYEGMRIIKH